MQLAPVTAYAPAPVQQPAVPGAFEHLPWSGVATVGHAGSLLPGEGHAAVMQWRAGWGDGRIAAPTWGGSSLDEARAAARQLAGRLEVHRVPGADGGSTVVGVNPAIAVLHDAQTGYWLTRLLVPMPGGEGLLPVAIDGPSVGPHGPLGDVTLTPTTDALVEVVGAGTAISYRQT